MDINTTLIKLYEFCKFKSQIEVDLFNIAIDMILDNQS